MTTRRKNSDLDADESRSHKYRKVQPNALGQAHLSKDLMPQSDGGVSFPLCYRLVRLPDNSKVMHIWFDGPRAGHARLCKFQDQLAGSFKTAAICINATIDMMRRPPSQNL